MILDKIRSVLSRARYQFSIAINMRAELSMVNKADPFLNWRVDWFSAWEKGTHLPKARLRLLMQHPSQKDFDDIYKQLNQDHDLVKFAECSNFAGHAIAILLREPEITVRYNVCFASTGSDLNHTLVILLPKGTVGTTLEWNKTDLISNGALIIDPWAMAMGFGADDALAVKPEAYIYSNLLDKVSFVYQSILDPALSSVALAREDIGTISTGRQLDLEYQLSPKRYNNKFTFNKISTIGTIPIERRLALSFRLFPEAHPTEPMASRSSVSRMVT